MLEHKYLKRSCCYGAWLAVLISVPGFITGRADGPVLTGAEIYRQKCASCHGASGEGTDEHYPRALIGERPVPALARLIAKTMPEDAPGECVGEDAQKVATYIYETFYSKNAPGRNKFRLPRIELSRLTVRQYRNVVTDLIGSFRNSSRIDQERGLKGEYTSRDGADETTTAAAARLIGSIKRLIFISGRAARFPSRMRSKTFRTGGSGPRCSSVPLRSFRPFSQEFQVVWQGSLLAPKRANTSSASGPRTRRSSR